MNFSKTFQIGTVVITAAVFSFFDHVMSKHDHQPHIHQEIIVPMTSPSCQIYVSYAGGALDGFSDDWSIVGSR